MKVSQALESRISCRAFLDQPVPRETVEKILKAASSAPSGGNLQPWRIYALSGEKLAGVVSEIGSRLETEPRGEGMQYRIYPKDLKDPFFSRRHKCGEDLYAAIEVEREDRDGRFAQFKRNFEFFGAPVALFLYLDRTMGPPQWADAGIFLQSLMLMARECGLHTCSQEAWAYWPETISRHVGAPEELILFCGICLGYMDETAPVNALRTDRAELAEFACLDGLE